LSAASSISKKKIPRHRDQSIKPKGYQNLINRVPQPEAAC
jgi:hypothetical protein